MKLLYTLIFAFFISCSTEPEDCAGVAGGNSYMDDCGGCDANVNNDCTQEWICTTDYISQDVVDPDINVSGILFEPIPPIYNSLDECESVCPNEPIAVTNAYFPNGTGEYFSMYCSENE